MRIKIFRLYQNNCGALLEFMLSGIFKGYFQNKAL